MRSPRMESVLQNCKTYAEKREGDLNSQTSLLSRGFSLTTPRSKRGRLPLRPSRRLDNTLRGLSWQENRKTRIEHRARDIQKETPVSVYEFHRYDAAHLDNSTYLELPLPRLLPLTTSTCELRC